MAEKRGEVIDLDECSCDYIRGHVSLEEAVQALNARHERTGEKALKPENFDMKHIYAAKLQTPACREHGWSYQFYTYEERGRGRFPVTQLTWRHQ